MTSPTALNGGLGQDILVLDRLGDNEAVLVAEALSGRGHNVTFATRYDSLAPFAGYTHRWDAARLFRRNKIPVLTDVDISSFDGGVASLRDPEGQIAHDIPVDTIVAVVAPSANDQLQNAFSGSGVAVHVIGDAVAPRGAATAIREADALLRSI